MSGRSDLRYATHRDPTACNAWRVAVSTIKRCNRSGYLISKPQAALPTMLNGRLSRVPSPTTNNKRNCATHGLSVRKSAPLRGPVAGAAVGAGAAGPASAARCPGQFPGAGCGLSMTETDTRAMPPDETRPLNSDQVGMADNPVGDLDLKIVVGVAVAPLRHDGKAPRAIIGGAGAAMSKVATAMTKARMHVRTILPIIDNLPPPDEKVRLQHYSSIFASADQGPAGA